MKINMSEVKRKSILSLTIRFTGGVATSWRAVYRQSRWKGLFL